ncbi:MAG: hydroxyacylglutathione hydrolase [Sandaracinaceae bacterium]|nr:hydroxyacylglutathione hydrolase [Sandaracinaceae bacterium]
MHAVTVPTPAFRTRDGSLAIHQVPAWQDNLIWIAVCTKSGDAAVIDGPDAGPVLDYCAQHSLQIRAILNTHTHADHVGINRALVSHVPGLRVVGPKRRAAEVPGLTEPVDEADVVRIGQVEGRVMLTEGHMDGHVSYVFADVVFCGDTMFGAGCGYLFDGPPSKMHASLERLAALDPSTRVCCAHEYTQDNLRFAYSVEPGNAALRQRIRRDLSVRARGESTIPSTIGEERATNPFLRHRSEELRANVARAMPDRGLDDSLAVFAATRALKDRKDYKSITDDELLRGS